MRSLRVNETKLILTNAFILDLFAVGGEKESKYNERKNLMNSYLNAQINSKDLI